MKFNENPCNESRVVASGRTDMTSQYWLSALLRTRLKSTVSKREEEEQVGQDKGRQRLIYRAHDICNSRFDCRCSLCVKETARNVERESCFLCLLDRASS